MRIALNLASRPYADLGPALKHLRIAMGVLALTAVALALGIHAFHQKAVEARNRERALDLQLSQLNQERLGYEQRMKQPDNAALLQHINILNQLFDEKAFSWTLAMEDLETVLPSGVQAVTLEPERSPKDGHTTLHMRVVGPRDKAVELVRNLEHSHYFILPAIVGESAESNGGPGQKLEPISPSNRFNFDVIATYNPAAITDTRRRQRPVEQDSAKTPAPAPVPVVEHKPAPMQPLINRPMPHPPIQTGVQPPMPAHSRPQGVPPTGSNVVVPFVPGQNLPHRPPMPTHSPEQGGQQ